MAHLRYGCLDPAPITKEYPVAATQYFRHDGPNFVYLDGNGRVALALAATATLFGYAIVPKGMGAGTSADYWLSGAAGVDKIAVVAPDQGYNFLVLADDTPTASQAGNACDLDAINDGTVYYANIGTSSTDVLVIQGRGVDFKADAGANDVVVKINPAKLQAVTT